MIRNSRFRSARTVAAVIALTAITGAMLLVGASPASAATTNWDLTASTNPSIFPASTGQAAGDIVVDTTASPVNVGDTLTLAVDDSNGGNCLLSTDFIEFASTPTLTVTAPTTGAPTYSVALASSPGACTTAGKHDLVVVTATASGAQGSFTLSGIKYNTGAGVATGNVNVTGTGTGAVTGSPAHNAHIDSISVTGNNPPVGIAQGSTGNAISPVKLQEFVANTLAGPTVCLTINSGNAHWSGTPTVSASGGGATASGAAIDSGDPHHLSFDIGHSTSGPATFTASAALDSTGSTGEVHINVGQGANAAAACADSSVATNVRISYVIDVTREAGGDRFSTAQILFDDNFGCENTAIIARGDNFPDALAANYLAGQIGTGILLTNTGSIPSATLNALRLEGVDNVLLVGGTAAISTDVSDQLAATPAFNCGGGSTTGHDLVVQRVGGDTRYSTARDVAEFEGLGAGGTIDLGLDATGTDVAHSCTPVKTAFLATGENFPDALAAGPEVYMGDTGSCGDSGEDTSLPLVLTPGSTLSDQAAATFTDMGIKQVIMMGGTAAISDTVKTQIEAMGIQVVRVAGTTRQGTAVALALIAGDQNTFDADGGTPAFTRGDNFPDALTGGPFAGDNFNVIFLTDSPTSLGTATSTGLLTFANNEGSPDADSGPNNDVTILGGTAAVANSVVGAILNVLAAQT